jgi:hypothetical protein
LRGEFAFAGASPSARNFSTIENILIIFPEGTRSETGGTGNSNWESARSSLGGTSRFALLFAGRFSRVAEGPASATSRKFDSLLAGFAIIRHATQTRSTCTIAAELHRAVKNWEVQWKRLSTP